MARMGWWWSREMIEFSATTLTQMTRSTGLQTTESQCKNLRTSSCTTKWARTQEMELINCKSTLITEALSSLLSLRQVPMVTTQISLFQTSLRWELKWFELQRAWTKLAWIWAPVGRLTFWRTVEAKMHWVSTLRLRASNSILWSAGNRTLVTFRSTSLNASLLKTTASCFNQRLCPFMRTKITRHRNSLVPPTPVRKWILERISSTLDKALPYRHPMTLPKTILENDLKCKRVTNVLNESTRPRKLCNSWKWWAPSSPITRQILHKTIGPILISQTAEMAVQWIVIKGRRKLGWELANHLAQHLSVSCLKICYSSQIQLWFWTSKITTTEATQITRLEASRQSTAWQTFSTGKNQCLYLNSERATSQSIKRTC